MSFTPGPWRWVLNKKHHEVTLEGGSGNDVMRFRRFGMDGAAPAFIAGGRVRRADEFGVVVVGREHHADWHQAIRHPDADLLAAAPNLLAACEAAEERLVSLVPGNSYGLLDHAADRERQETLTIVRAAIRLAKGGKP